MYQAIDMAYTKANWKERLGIGLNRFFKFQETDTEVYLNNVPVSISEPGTQLTPDVMNNIENGIENAHIQIDDLNVDIQTTNVRLTEIDQTLTTADENLNSKIEAEISNRQIAREQQIDSAINNEAQARQTQVDELNGQIQATNHVLDGVHTTSLTGATLTRVLGGTTDNGAYSFIMVVYIK